MRVPSVAKKVPRCPQELPHSIRASPYQNRLTYYNQQRTKPNLKNKFDDVKIPIDLFKQEPHLSVLRPPWSAKGYGVRFLLFQQSNPNLAPSLPVPGKRMLNFVQLATTPTADTTGTSIILTFDNQKYVFGSLAEGTQRAFTQRKVGLNKIEHVFLAGLVDWQNAGGLLGAILTVADIYASAKESFDQNNEERRKRGKGNLPNTLMSRLHIHGGKNIAQLLATSRKFIFRKGFPLTPHEILQDSRSSALQRIEPDFKDANINVWYLPVASSKSSNSNPSQLRKRSHEEFSEESEGDEGHIQPEMSRSEEDQKFVESVVTQMFESDWKMDALVETTLHKAQLPAKLFVRDDKGHIQVYNGPLPGGDKPVPDIPVLVRQPWPGAMIQSLPRTTPSNRSMCYIVKGHDRRGRFDPTIAEKHGIPKSNYKVLIQGRSVTGENGVVVTPEMVLGETVPGIGFAVVNIPDHTYIESLIKRSEWDSEEIMKGIRIIFWLLGPGLSGDPKIREFMAKMSSLRHIVTSPDDCPNMLALESVSSQTYRLHCIDPDRFPLPDFNNERSLSNTPIKATETAYELGRTGKTVQFAPQYLHEDDKVVPFPDIAKIASSDMSKETREAIQQITDRAKARLSDPELLAKIEKVETDIPNRDAEVIPLGTGSALPSKYRNVSATLVRVPGSGNYLFDCGENTIGSMRRAFGSELPQVLRDLKVIWISHLHADHHLGTVGVIKAWHEETSKSKETAKSKLLVASHPHMHDWLREYANVEEYGHGRLEAVEISKYEGATKISKPVIFTAAQTAAYGLARLDACFVSHCYGALAVAMTWPSGLKVAYSGDCRPSDAFVKIGHGATLLIHESTFDDELRGDAIAKKHCTMSEAIDVGRRMAARRILLTHFSQRYQKIPILDENLEIRVAERGDEVENEDEKARLDQVVLVAFDYMRVRLGEFRKAQAFLPAIQKLFEDVEDQ